MNYVIKGVRKTQLPKKAGGTWTKIEVKTEQTGDTVLELGQGIANKEGIAKGTVINGYVEDRKWTGKNGSTGINKVLNGITAEYVYKMLLSIHPELVDFNPSGEAAPKAENDDFDEQPAATETTDEEIDF